MVVSSEQLAKSLTPDSNVAEKLSRDRQAILLIYGGGHQRNIELHEENRAKVRRAYPDYVAPTQQGDNSVLALCPRQNMQSLRSPKQFVIRGTRLESIDLEDCLGGVRMHVLHQTNIFVSGFMPGLLVLGTEAAHFRALQSEEAGKRNQRFSCTLKSMVGF